MRRFHCAALAAVAVFGFASVASAADMPVKAPVYKAPPAVVYDPWTGFYIGANVGYSWGRTSTDYTTTDPNAGISETNSDSINMNGVIGGGQLGYNYRFNQNFLVGIEADFQGSGEKGSNTLEICHDGAVVPGGVCDIGSHIYDSYTEKLNWFGTVRGRVGYLVTPAWLLYATGGLAYGKLTRDDTYTYNDTYYCNAGTEPYCTPQSNSISAVKTGWVIGGGVETALSGHWTGRIEYLYMNLAGLGTSNFVLTNGNPYPINLTTNSHQFTDNILRFAINYRFASP